MATKKLFMVILMVALLPLSSISHKAYASDVELQVGYHDPQTGKDPGPKSPVLIPHVDLNAYTLTFISPCDGCTLCLLDEDGDVVYSTVIPVGSTTLVLPSYLSGEYEIQIIRGIFCFYGYIEL